MHSQSQRLPAQGTKRLISKLWSDLTFHGDFPAGQRPAKAASHRHFRGTESPVTECGHSGAWTAVQVGS